MNDTQQLIFDQYIEYLFQGSGAETRTALIGLTELAIPEAIPHLLSYIEHIGERWQSWGWGWSMYEEWVNLARTALDAIYIKAGKESVEQKTQQNLYGHSILVEGPIGETIDTMKLESIIETMKPGDIVHEGAFTIRKSLLPMIPGPQE